MYSVVITELASLAFALSRLVSTRLRSATRPYCPVIIAKTPSIR